jgi:5'-methylthioadenosine phosphorylase
MIARPAADVGIFGGSGFYSFLTEPEPVSIDTAWGVPSAPVTVGMLDDVRVAFLPRHGVHHEFPPHRINYRANVDAMRQLGVQAILASFAAGSLRPEIRPGDVVIVDQFVDHTTGRAATFHDRFDHGPRHATMADPYDRRLRALAIDACDRLGIAGHAHGTVVVIDGPRFATRAESGWFRSAGWHLVNMTQSPEVPLAVEADVPIAGIGLVTDYDTGPDGAPDVEPVNQDTVLEVFQANLRLVRQLLSAIIPTI